MTASLSLFSILVSAALVVTLFALVILIFLFIRDRKKGELW